jgi:hypothetical protein
MEKARLSRLRKNVGPGEMAQLSPALYNLRKESVLYLILDGAAVHRCSKRMVLNPALAAEGRCSMQRDFFRSL